MSKELLAAERAIAALEAQFEEELRAEEGQLLAMINQAGRSLGRLLSSALRTG